MTAHQPSPSCPCDICALIRRTLATFAVRSDKLQLRADEIYEADRAEDRNLQRDETGSSLVPTVLTLATLAGILAVGAAVLWPLLHGLVNALTI